jgi:hypothetical protein
MLNRVDSSRIDSAMDGKIVEDQPEIEEQRSEIPQAAKSRGKLIGRHCRAKRSSNNGKQLGDREIASETKQQITHRERGKAE